jgi:hypothetical protein
MKLFAVLLTAAAAAGAQTTALAPLSGYVYNSGSRTLHALHGVPGSAYVGRAIAADLDRAWPAPAGAIAVAVRAEETIVLRGLDQPEPSVEEGIGLLSSPALAAWSPEGAAFALYGNGQVQVVRVTRGRINPDVPVNIDFVGEIAAIAVNDAGGVAVASGGGVYLHAASGSTLLHSSSDIRSLRFGAAGQLYAAAADRLLRMDTAGGEPSVLVADIRIDAFALSRANGLFYLADAERQALEIYDSGGNKTGTIHLDRTPSASIQALVHESLFLINAPDDSGRPAIVLQVSENPSVLFVPAESSTTL